MAAGADWALRGVAGVCKNSHLTGEAGKVIVRDELLNFLDVTIKTGWHHCFGWGPLGWSRRSTPRKGCFDLCPSTTRRLMAHTMVQKDAKNIKNCLKLLHEVGEDTCFVSHYLEELPGVTFIASMFLVFWGNFSVRCRCSGSWNRITFCRKVSLTICVM